MVTYKSKLCSDIIARWVSKDAKFWAHHIYFSAQNLRSLDYHMNFGHDTNANAGVILSKFSCSMCVCVCWYNCVCKICVCLVGNIMLVLSSITFLVSCVCMMCLYSNMMCLFSYSWKYYAYVVLNKISCSVFHVCVCVCICVRLVGSIILVFDFLFTTC